MASQSGQDGIDYKYPTWDGSWDRWLDYHLRVELRADGMKQEELPFLGPRLASNLSGRAFDAISDIDREKLRKEEGWKYLLEFWQRPAARKKWTSLEMLSMNSSSKETSTAKMVKNLSTTSRASRCWFASWRKLWRSQVLRGRSLQNCLDGIFSTVTWGWSLAMWPTFEGALKVTNWTMW